jgi:phosphoketolase
MDLLKAPAAKLESARPERLVFDILFTRDRPIVLAFHGYSWLTYRLACSRSAAAGAPRRADSAADTV